MSCGSIVSGGGRRSTTRCWPRRRLDAVELMALGESGDGGVVVEKEVHLVIPEVGGGAEAGERAGRGEGGVGAAVPVVIGIRSGRRGSLRCGSAIGSPGWIHAGCLPGTGQATCTQVQMHPQIFKKY
jgi:hypothetical protein